MNTVLFAPNTKTDNDADLKSNYFDGNLPTADIQKLHAKYGPMPSILLPSLISMITYPPCLLIPSELL